MAGRTLPCLIYWYRKIFPVERDTRHVQTLPFNHTRLMDCLRQNRNYWCRNICLICGRNFCALHWRHKGRGETKQSREAEFVALQSEYEDVLKKWQARQGKRIWKKNPLFRRGTQKRQHKTSTELHSYLDDWFGICSLFVCREQNLEQFLSGVKCLEHLVSLQEFMVASEFHK